MPGTHCLLHTGLVLVSSCILAFCTKNGDKQMTEQKTSDILEIKKIKQHVKNETNKNNKKTKIQQTMGHCSIQAFKLKLQ